MTRLLFLFYLAIGPWITGMRENSFSVLWTSDEECIAWVQLENGERIYEEFAGRRTHSRFHHIKIEGLKAGTEISYSIGCRNVIDKKNPRRPEYGEEILNGPYKVRTFSRDRKDCNFTVMNDVHMNLQRYRSYVSQIDPEATDFIFLNGDIISAGHHPVDSVVKYEIEPLGALSARIPVMFARGNHEGRGDGIRNIQAVYPNDNDDLPFSYMFREGPAAFIVLDAGETGVKNSLAFCGEDIYEDYIRNQMEWASKVMKSREWRSAKVRICLLHVPMVDPGVPDDYVVHTWMNHNFVPVLNKGGVNLMIGADLHEYQFHEPGTMGNDFPILVNDNQSRLEANITGNGIAITIYDEVGNTVHTHLVKK